MISRLSLWEAAVFLASGLPLIVCSGASGVAPERAMAADFADPAHRSAWLQHPVLGGPSFDAFERMPGNPVHRGAPPYEWPVNGYLFEDPVGGAWYLYIGEYLDGYELSPDTPCRCIAYRSDDRGRTWTHLGPIFSEAPHVFEGEVSPVSHAPDVTVTYHEGRYHLAFDWVTENSNWANAASPGPSTNSGAGYAWSLRPEGPFQPAPRPMATTREQPEILGKYRRLYATTLLRRRNDWLALILTDSGPYFGWGYLGTTAPAPEGPFPEPVLLLHPEKAGFHPPLQEFHPAFVHEDYVYAPATSVALNRNHQVLYRAPLEDAMNPDAWELYRAGSLWHAEPVEHEAYGIWGQTFSGFVDTEGVFHVMFPSRDADGLGTINLASRPWAAPYREHGFAFSGHQGPSLTLLKQQGALQRIAFEANLRGVVSLIWGAHMPMGADRPRSNSTLHPLTQTRYRGLEMAETAWRLVAVDAAGARSIVAEGALEPVETRAVRMEWENGEEAVLHVSGQPVWRGAFACSGGAIGLLAQPHSHAEVSRFEAIGRLAPGSAEYLYTDALTGAAQNLAHWEEVEDGAFRYGIGAVSRQAHVSAKWHFEGRGFRLYAPRGAAYGRAEVRLNGQPIAELDYSAEASEASAVVLERLGLPGGRHGLSVHPVEGRIPIDTLQTVF